MQNKKLLNYIQQGVDRLIEQECFENGWAFKKTQGEALHAYRNFLHDERLTIDERLKGFFEIPTGVGKTAVFAAIIGAAYEVAQAHGEQIKTIIVVPTNQLVDQTVEAMELFAPVTAGQIGVYDGRKKNLKLPITVTTYDSWVTLCEQGVLSSDNVDILISDEAHRGTSERRVNLNELFNSQTLQLAFTATAHFDEEKSVQASHERQIYYKSMRDAVLDDELASYIQAQRVIIRVEPTAFMLSEEFAEASTSERTLYRRRIRQQTWNEFALKTFLDGRDERTGDLLSDNQVGFFVEGIEQANHLEGILNRDKVLAQRAKARGCKGVAVAIHSDMSYAEQKRRFEAYQNGEYMGVIGDEKFKEGFDHPPMKTLFDTMHSSVVDKAQIVGRGARKWWNEDKQRFEGLTVIDSTIYIGSHDPKEDGYIKDAALRTSVTVKDILEDLIVLSPSALRQSPGPGSGGLGGGYDLFDDDPNIEYVVDLEELYRLEKGISELRRDHWILLDDELKAELQAESERVGTTKGIMKFMKDAPSGLTDASVYNIVWGIQKTAPVEHVDAIRRTFSSMKTLSLVKLDGAVMAEILAEKARTGAGERFIFGQMQNKPDGITKDNIRDILNGTKKETSQEYVDAILETYRSLRKLSVEERKKIKAAKKDKKYPFKRIIEQMPEDAGFTKSELTRVLSLADTFFRDDVINAAMDYIFPSLREAVTQKHIDDILAERERTGVGFSILVKTFGKACGFNLNNVKAIAYGYKKTTPKGQIEDILNAYGSLPDASPEGPSGSDPSP